MGISVRDTEQSAEIDMRIFGSPSHIVFHSLGKATGQIGSASHETTCRSSPDTSGSRRAGRKVRKSENSWADFQRMSTGVHRRGRDLHPITTFRCLHTTTPCAAARKSHTTGAIALPVAVGATSRLRSAPPLRNRIANEPEATLFQHNYAPHSPGSCGSFENLLMIPRIECRPVVPLRPIHRH
jgi:hypothetical protein